MNLLYTAIASLILWFSGVSAFPTLPVGHEDLRTGNHSVSPALFESLEELARLVDISYCVGTTGIYQPFQCASRCKEFDGFELVSVFATPSVRTEKALTDPLADMEHRSSSF